MTDVNEVLTYGLTRKQSIRWRNAIFVVFGLGGFGLANWLARVPAIRDGLEATTTEMGFILFGSAAGSIIGLTAAGHLVAHFGGRAVMTGALLLIGLGLPVLALGSTLGIPAVIFLGLAIFGTGAGVSDVASNVSGAVNERVLDANLMPLFHAAFSVGTVIGVGTGALAEWLAVPILVHLSIVCVIIAAPILTINPWIQSEHVIAGDDTVAAQSAAKDEGWRSRLSMWLDPRTLLLGLMVLGMAFAEGAANDWLPLAMVDGHGLENSTGAVALGVFLLAMTVGRIGGVFLLNRFSRVAVLRGSALVAAAGLATVIWAPDPALAFAGAILWGLGTALGFPVGMSAAADDPAKATARVSTVATIGYLAFLAGPPVLGFLGDHIGLLGSLGVVLVFVLVSGVIAGVARPRVSTSPTHAPAPTPHRIG